MDLRGQLRKTETTAAFASQEQINRTRKECADAERRCRQKMRIYRDESASGNASDSEDQDLQNGDLRLPVGGRAAEELRDPEIAVARKVIVSIYGRDLIYDYDTDDDECGHLIQTR